MIISLARRVATLDDVTQAGDYTGPHPIEKDEITIKVVWFLLPTHKGMDAFDRPDEHSGLHGVFEPPWEFRECSDGSLEVRASIGCGSQSYYWHGYLDEGNQWRQLV